MEKKESYSFSDLLRIIEVLTGENGCPWDKEQTHESIRINMIEEAYEAVDAIDSRIRENIVEELGDVLLQAVLHCDIAKRNNEFDISDVITRLCEKLISRHTHIFADKRADDGEQALQNWEEAKKREKSYDSLKEQLKNYPDIFPSLLLSQKIFKKTNRLDESQIKNELLTALNENDLGKFLFLSSGICALNKKDSEIELNKYCKSIIENL